MGWNRNDLEGSYKIDLIFSTAAYPQLKAKLEVIRKDRFCNDMLICDPAGAERGFGGGPHAASGMVGRERQTP